MIVWDARTMGEVARIDGVCDGWRYPGSRERKKEKRGSEGEGSGGRVVLLFRNRLR